MSFIIFFRNFIGFRWKKSFSFFCWSFISKINLFFSSFSIRIEENWSFVRTDKFFKRFIFLGVFRIFRDVHLVSKFIWKVRSWIWLQEFHEFFHLWWLLWKVLNFVLWVIKGILAWYSSLKRVHLGWFNIGKNGNSFSKFYKNWNKEKSISLQKLH